MADPLEQNTSNTTSATGVKDSSADTAQNIGGISLCMEYVGEKAVDTGVCVGMYSTVLEERVFAAF